MGNYKFKFSDMIPNAWFYKLKYSSTTRKQKNITNKKQHQTSSSIAASAQQAPKLMLQPQVSNQRKSYHFTRDHTAALLHRDSFYNNLTAYLRELESLPCPEPPRKSSKQRRSTRRSTRQSNRRSPRLVTSSFSAGCSCRATLESVWAKPDPTPEHYPNSPLHSSSENESVLPQYGSDVSLIPDTFDGMVSWSTSCRCRVDTDFIIETENKPSGTKIDNRPDDHKPESFDKVSELFELPPIITKPNQVVDKIHHTNNEPTKNNRSSANKFEEKTTAYGSFSAKVVQEDTVKTTCPEDHKYNSPVRKSSGVKLRTNSPRIANRRMQGRKSVSSTSTSSSSSRRSLSESFAVVKSSKDPWKDFRESMVEMILENNIFASKDLEELLACYLSLNSDEYHDLIIKVFKQIWFDIIHPRLK